MQTEVPSYISFNKPTSFLLSTVITISTLALPEPCHFCNNSIRIKKTALTFSPNISTNCLCYEKGRMINLYMKQVIIQYFLFHVLNFPQLFSSNLLPSYNLETLLDEQKMNTSLVFTYTEQNTFSQYIQHIFFS